MMKKRARRKTVESRRNTHGSPHSFPYRHIFVQMPASRQERLEGPASYVELAEAIVNWLAEIPVAFCSITRRILRGHSQGLAPREAV